MAWSLTTAIVANGVMNRIDVLIAGAGIGGLALANGLIADGHRVRVLEAGPSLRLGGAAVTIFSNGHAALAGIGAPLPDLGGAIDEMRFVRADGARIARLDLTVMAARTGHPVRTIPRDRLIGELARRLPDGVVQFASGVAGVTVASEGVDVTDSDGHSYAADLVVGADGHASAVRTAVVDAQPATSTGWTTWQGLTGALPDMVAGVTGVCIVGAAGLCGLMPAGDGLLQWWFDVRTPDGLPRGEAALPMLRRQFADYAHPVPDLLDVIQEADLGAYPHVVHRVPDAWGTGPTTLLGDAAHAFPPSQAQGANQALEDAWMLTHALRLPGAVSEKVRRYERRRLRRVRRVSRIAASEVTNEPPRRFAAVATRAMTAPLAGRIWLSAVRRYSSVLNDERP